MIRQISSLYTFKDNKILERNAKFHFDTLLVRLDGRLGSENLFLLFPVLRYCFRNDITEH